MASWVSGTPNDYLKQCAMTLFSQFYMDRWVEDLPDGWSYQRVEEFAEKVAMGPFGSNIKVETFVDEGVPIISSAHLRGLLLEELEYNHITEEHANRLANSMVYPGDIVFTHAGNIGQASLVTKWAAEPKYMISQRQFYLRCNQDKMLSEIPALYFHTRVGRHVLTANSSSTGVPSIAQPSSYLKSIEIIVPDMESQHAFVNQIEPMLHQYVVNEKEIRRLEQLRDALLPKLMSGEIDVSQIELPKQSNNHLPAQSTATPHTVPNPLKGKEQFPGRHHQYRFVPHAAPARCAPAQAAQGHDESRIRACQDPASLGPG